MPLVVYGKRTEHRRIAYSSRETCAGDGQHSLRRVQARAPPLVQDWSLTETPLHLPRVEPSRATTILPVAEATGATLGKAEIPAAGVAVQLNSAKGTLSIPALGFDVPF